MRPMLFDRCPVSIIDHVLKDGPSIMRAKSRRLTPAASLADLISDPDGIVGASSMIPGRMVCLIFAFDSGGSSLGVDSYSASIARAFSFDVMPVRGVYSSDRLKR